MTNILLVGLGGGLGSIARYAISLWMWSRYGLFPLGTLAVNVAGCMAIGALLSLSENHPLQQPGARALLAAGVLGGFTTFSSFGFETITLLHQDRPGAAALNVALNVALGLGAAWLGRALVMR